MTDCSRGLDRAALTFRSLTAVWHFPVESTVTWNKIKVFSSLSYAIQHHYFVIISTRLLVYLSDTGRKSLYSSARH